MDDDWGGIPLAVDRARDRAATATKVEPHPPPFAQATEYLFAKNAALYQRLPAWYDGRPADVRAAAASIAALSIALDAATARAEAAEADAWQEHRIQCAQQEALRARIAQLRQFVSPAGHDAFCMYWGSRHEGVCNCTLPARMALYQEARP